MYGRSFRCWVVISLNFADFGNYVRDKIDLLASDMIYGVPILPTIVQSCRTIRILQGQNE